MDGIVAALIADLELVGREPCEIDSVSPLVMVLDSLGCDTTERNRGGGGVEGGEGGGPKVYVRLSLLAVTTCARSMSTTTARGFRDAAGASGRGFAFDLGAEIEGSWTAASKVDASGAVAGA